MNLQTGQGGNQSEVKKPRCSVICTPKLQTLNPRVKRLGFLVLILIDPNL